ncbi:MAG: hypothetical protein A2571_03070 [Candidatus Vogelbacteria bacterium RIFOXYD1_FULL_44_32]|uniref:Peptidase S54 rhomboid domain-containing protein n=1 Tax=Candidatus Vogelbacteria bacterium RIFOXYD1_FULL_44_32 TaxID=1802438 RepID=A0A1G2QCK6_9BACT|nr:MAG: hypothetical protein A2571_03070 [Candidatus Vogelbacteria bacterium RIFOXYD1_FULL_44_32]
MLEYIYMKDTKASALASYFARNFLVVVGLVLVWRGVWYILDGLDFIFLSGNHLLSGILGVILGMLLLYLPDKDLKEISKL